MSMASVVTLLEHALAQAKEGFAVFPLRERDKRPLLPGGHNDEAAAEVAAWFTVVNVLLNLDEFIMRE